MRRAEQRRPGSARVAAPRWLAAVTTVALALHAALLAGWLADLAARPDATLLPWQELLPAAATAASAALAALAFPRRARLVATVSIVIAAVALLGPGAVATVASMMLSAHVAGCALLRFAAGGGGGRDPIELPGAATCILTGAALWIGLIAAAIGLSIHYAPVYALVVVAALLASPRLTRASLEALCRGLAVDDAPSPSARAWIAAAVGIAVMHVIVVARPDVGYDAGTMHLQFAQLLGHDHRWRFDVGRYAWAVMPMGADDVYAAAYLLDGERAARLVNLLFGALLCAATYGLVRRHAGREAALGSVCLLASTPLWFLESSTLFVDFGWTAFLVAALASTLAFAERRGSADFAAAAICCAGAMQCKAIGVFWVVPLAVALLYGIARHRQAPRGRVAALCAVAIVAGAWPYANAWLRTGNPVFPFLNTVFGSPLFESATPFNNPAYNAPLAWSTPYDLVMASGRYIEGFDGAAGVHWLLLYPLIAIALVTRATRVRWTVFALAAGFAGAVYAHQSYLRYLIPAIVLVAILGGWALDDWMQSARARASFAAIGIGLVAANLWLMPAASWTNATTCAACAFDAGARDDYVARYAPLRNVADYLNRNLPGARIGFLVFNAPAPSGFVGYSRAANWHDTEAFAALSAAKTVDDVAAVARRFRLTHAVFRDRPELPADRLLLEFRDRRTVPVARVGDYVIAAIRAAEPP